MTKEAIISFGDREKFSIDINQKTKGKYTMQVWFLGISIGNLKNRGSVNYLINSYLKLLKTLEKRTDKDFKSMRDQDIFNEIVYDVSLPRPIEKEDELFERLQLYNFEFGDTQFNEYTFIVFFLQESKMLKFLVYEMDSKNGNNILYSFNIPYDYFNSVLKDLIEYINSKSS